MEIEGLICTLITLIIIFAWRLFEYLKKLQRNQDMFKKVGWIAEKECNTMCYSDSVRLRDMELISYIMEEQKKLNLPKRFCLDYSNDNEKKDAEEILNLHKNDVIKSYFHGLLTISKNIYKLSSLEYYFYSLYCFIYKELDEHKYQDKKYTNEEYTDKTYFSCQLTDYGRTYYKLYLITFMFIEKNEKTRKLFKYINHEHKQHIAKNLDKNEVQFWTYRP